MKQCSSCHSVKYCSKNCQKKHWEDHKTICNAIKYLSSKNTKYSNNVDDCNGMFSTHLTPRQHVSLVKLMGKQCMVNCYLNDIQTSALWDTGAQVSILSKNWLEQNIPETQIQDLQLLLEIDIDLRAANGTVIPYEGWIELTFRLFDKNPNCVLTVPFLVISSNLDSPLIGYNVIEEVVKMKSDSLEDDSLSNSLTNSFVGVTNQTAETLVNFFQSSSSSELCPVKSGKFDTKEQSHRCNM